MNKQEVVSLLCRILESYNHPDHHNKLTHEIDQAIVGLQLPATKKQLSDEHKQKISAAMRNNQNRNKVAEKPARDMVWVKDATGALIQQPAPRRRNPMSQETKDMIASSMLGNKNRAKGR